MRLGITAICRNRTSDPRALDLAAEVPMGSWRLCARVRVHLVIEMYTPSMARVRDQQEV